MANVPEDRDGEQSYLHHNETIHLNRLSAYYACFTTHPPFQESIDTLAQTLSDTVGRAVREEAESAALFFSDPAASARENLRRSLQEEYDDDATVFSRGMDQSARNDLVVFATQWWLPIRTGYLDVWRALLHHRPVEPYQLTPTRSMRMRLMPSGMIFPHVVAPFLYNPAGRPTSWIRDYADKVARQVRDSIIEQAKRFDGDASEAGWKERPPLYRNDARVQALALRLFRAAVLNLTNAEIGGLESRERREDSMVKGDESADFSERSISRTINEWATDLGLPPLQRGRR
jgi:hypothetical protein